MPKRKKSVRFVSRGGDKLDGALVEFGLDLTGKTAADLGANVGGFTDCLLQRGVTRVYAVETGYGVLDWTLRQDDRVIVMERTNALHVTLPERVYVVVIDVGWTPVGRIVPVAMDLLSPDGFVVALLKPQYEARPDELKGGVVIPPCLENVVDRALTGLLEQCIQVIDQRPSSIAGSGGNLEYLVLLKPA